MTISNPNRIALVTGATGGIGKETARGLAALGWQVVLAGRNPQKLAEIQLGLQKEFPNAKLDALVVDLASLADITRFCENFLANYPRLDVLVNNAGAIFMEREVKPGGLEHTFALNHLGYFATTLQLMPALRAGQNPRIVNVASAAHWFGRVRLDDLQWEKHKYQGWNAYADSKLMNILFSFALARRLAGSNILVNCLHPGMVASNFGKNNNSGLSGLGFNLFSLFAISNEQGAKTSLYLASDPQVKESGRYWAKSRPAKTLASATNEKLQEQLWQVSETLSGLKWASYELT